ncbi:MarR family winged helix-turn-helix transcriptional regulator [Falsirhodobacter xinxiangensis]|uniref:MarR family winged helix-turn-helix transcriptional regulator n=1 Tax=Falsirhodobacter xinxiangensis TaxID=2530049 RepID=UPI0010AA299B|nr:MarR family transcriptional regulator [Rhodobacter xinxiangensis]
MTDASRQRLRLWLNMLKATRHVELEVRERLRVDFDTTLPRFDVLAVLSRHPEGLRLSDLSKELMVSNGNVTVVVDRLAEDALVERLPVPGDRRAWQVRLTPAGEGAIRAMTDAHRDWIDRLFGGLDDAQIAAAIDTLSAIRKPA